MAGKYRVPLCNDRQLFGVFLAAHAIPDALDMMHTGVGCKPKAQHQLARHDQRRGAQSKMVWSDISEVHLIAGSGAQLEDMTVETWRRRGEVGLIFITTSTAIEMTGLDVEALADEIRPQVDCPVVYLPTPGFDGDFHAGYARAIQAVMELCPWSTVEGQPQTVNLVGYLFDRYEHDHAMNLHELQRLLTGIGLEVGTTFLSGTPVAGLLEAPRAGANLLLPLAGQLEGWAAETAGRPQVTVDLPLGLRHTRLFLERVAGCVGVPDRRVRELVAREERQLEPLLRPAREGLAGRRLAILADTPTAVGLACIALELSLEPLLIGLLDQTLGGEPAFRAGLARVGAVPDRRCQVLENPDADEVAAAWRALGRRRGPGVPDLLIAPDVWLPPAVTAGCPRIEIGFPSNNKRALYAQPLLGFRGVVAVAQRLLDAASGVH